MNKKNQDFDIVIVGGGLAGLSLSALLAKDGWNIACIDAAPLITKKPKDGDLRTTAISYGSRKVLEEAGIWDKLDGQTCPIRDIQILDGASPLLLNFLSEEAGNKDFGWIVENIDLRLAMAKTIKKLKNVTHIAPAKVSGFEVEETSARVLLEGRQTLSAKLVIGADGRNSFTRAWMGVKTRQWSYDQRAVICTVSHSGPHKNAAIEHFWPEGPFAILPMADDKKGVHRSSVVFTEHGPEEKSLMHFTDREFETALAARFPKSYGDIKLIQPRAFYPLSLIHAADYIAPRMALVADAAHGIHPIAGQGLNLGFRDIAALAKTLKDAPDPGAPEILKQYQSARRADNMSMVALTDGLVRLFSNNIAPVRALRKLGLRAVSKIPPAKRFFMTRAMGEK